MVNSLCNTIFKVKDDIPANISNINTRKHQLKGKKDY